MAGTRIHTGRAVRRGAFTLVEVVLVIAILSVLATFVWPMFSGERVDKQLHRGAQRLSALMAMCRAQAMLLGHPFQLTWPDVAEGDAGQPVVLHENDPLEAAGQFVPVAAAWANEPVLPKDVRLRLVQLGPLNLAALAETQGQFELPEEPSVATVTFYPDGTADAAVFVLSIESVDGEKVVELQEWVVLDGISGMADARWPPTAEQLAIFLEQQADLPELKLEEEAVELAMENARTNSIAEGGVAGLIAGVSGLAGGGQQLSSTDLQEIEALVRSLQGQLSSGGAGNQAGGAARTGDEFGGGVGAGDEAGGQAGAGDQTRPRGRRQAGAQNEPPQDDAPGEPTRRRGGGRRATGGRQQ